MTVRLLLLVLAVEVSACAGVPKPVAGGHVPPMDARLALHVINRTTFGPRPGDVDRLQAIGLPAYLDEQLHPERLPDEAVTARLTAFTPLAMTTRQFATDYYAPMTVARREIAGPPPSSRDAVRTALRWRLQPILAVTLPGGDKPVSIVAQPAVTPEEARFQRANQQAFDALQAQKLLRAVYGDRQLEEVLTDFWFNHFNVDARKIEERPVTVAYERDVIRPRVLGRFRDLLGATAKSPAMLFYLDNWLNRAAAPPKPGQPAKPASGTGVNENYARELLELHTLGVDGGYTQRDVVEVARAFTGWTMNPHDGVGFVFNEKMHDRGEKRVLGHRLRAGRGIEDGEDVLDLLARRPATARFVATKLVRRFVADDPPRPLVERAAKTFLRTDGDLREVMRTILTSPEFLSPAAYRAKVKTPFEFVASSLRATGADITVPARFVGTVASLGEPLYQCQPPTGYGDRASTWMNTGVLIARLNFAESLAMNGVNGGARTTPGAPDLPARLAVALLADDLSPETRRVALATAAAPAVRLGLLLGSPEFQRR